MDALATTGKFREVCTRLVDRPGLSTEWTYRIRKIMDSMDVLEDKTYLKTLKGKEMLSQCIEKAIFLKEYPVSDPLSYRLLTDLEMTCEAIIVQACRFRIKAG